MTVNNDCISRRAAKLKVARVIWEDGDSCYDFHDKCVDCLDDLPSVQPTLYGYKIEHLAYIARVMEKEGVTAEYAVRTFDDISRAVRMILDETQQEAEEILNGCRHQNLMQKGIKNEDCGRNS